MNYRLNFESEAWGDSEFGDALEMDALEMFDEGEAEMLDPELSEEMLDERSTVPPIRQRFFRSRRPAARRSIFRRRAQPPRPPRRRPRILPGLIRQSLIDPIVDIADSPVDVSDAPVDVDAAPADTGDSTVDQSDSPSDADDSTATEYELTFEVFNPIAVESPGGRRIQNKTDPKPADVETVIGVGGKSIKLHRLAAAAWRALVKAARADGIAEPLLLIVSGYRSSSHQKRLWEAALKKYGSKEEARKWVAPPGGSAHQSGRAIDFYLGDKNSSANVAKLRELSAYKWLAANAERFGFYPYSAEPWHWEYNPPAAAGSQIEPESLELETRDSYAEFAGLELFEEETNDHWLGEAPRKTLGQVKQNQPPLQPLAPLTPREQAELARLTPEARQQFNQLRAITDTYTHTARREADRGSRVLLQYGYFRIHASLLPAFIKLTQITRLPSGWSISAALPLLVGNVLYNLAFPETINQGGSDRLGGRPDPTCFSACTQILLAKRLPSVYVQLTIQLATTRRAKFIGGESIGPLTFVSTSLYKSLDSVLLQTAFDRYFFTRAISGNYTPGDELKVQRQVFGPGRPPRQATSESAKRVAAFRKAFVTNGGNTRLWEIINLCVGNRTPVCSGNHSVVLTRIANGRVYFYNPWANEEERSMMWGTASVRISGNGERPAESSMSQADFENQVTAVFHN